MKKRPLIMRVLIVGGAGYVGGAVTDLLMKSKHDFCVYDNLLYEDAYLKPVKFIRGDIRDHQKLLPLFKWADAVVWLAALVGDGACAINPEDSIQINQESVKWLADNFNGRIIYTSTCSVYGAQDEILDETSPTNPLSVYAMTKLAAEEHLKSKNAMILRYGTLFGVSDTYSRVRFDLVVNTLTLNAYDQGYISIFGGEQYRPLLHVKDAASAIVTNLTTEHTGIFNLHSQNIKISDLANQVSKHFPGLDVRVTPMKFEDSRNYKVSSKKSETAFGFKPKYSIDDGISEIKSLLENNRLKDLKNNRYINQRVLEVVLKVHKSF